MYIPEFFKYASLVSAPLFVIVAVWLIKQTTKYQVRVHTISQSIHYLANSKYKIVFRLNFVIKAVLDLCFSLYVLQFYSISLLSIPSVSLIVSAVLFGLLAFFIEGPYSKIHGIFVYTSGVLWALGYVLIVLSTQSGLFVIYSISSLFFPILIGFITQFLSRTNVFVQIVCVGIWYLWLFLFTINYL